MTTQTLTKTCEPESSTQTQWRGHISCPPKKKDEVDPVNNLIDSVIDALKQCEGVQCEVLLRYEMCAQETVQGACRRSELQR